MEIVKTFKKGDMVILSGNIPSSLQSDSYQRVIKVLNEGVDFVVDAEKDLLMKTLPYHPFLIKPNNLEIRGNFWYKINK